MRRLASWICGQLGPNISISRCSRSLKVTAWSSVTSAFTPLRRSSQPSSQLNRRAAIIILTPILEMAKEITKMRVAHEEGCKRVGTRGALARMRAARKRKILVRRRPVAKTLKRTTVLQKIKTQRARRKKSKKRRRA